MRPSNKKASKPHMRRPYWIPFNAPADDFPPLEHALEQPDGLLAIGGDLNVRRLLVAYQRGIFPWYSDDQPILWWSPDPRMVLFPEQLKVSRSLRKNIRNSGFRVTLNQAFEAVLFACARVPRRDQEGTWITADIQTAYTRLHEQGFAHSVECWYQDQLVGGLYGVSLGKVFFGESMFSLMSNASKVAFTRFVEYLHTQDYRLIDCQIHSEHLASLGAQPITRKAFKQCLETACTSLEPANDWPTEL